MLKSVPKFIRRPLLCMLTCLIPGLLAAAESADSETTPAPSLLAAEPTAPDTSLAAKSTFPDTTLEAVRALLGSFKDRGEKNSFEYKGEAIHMLGDTTIFLQGNASVFHKGARLEAAEIIFYPQQQRAEARAAQDSNGVKTGSPVLEHGKETIRGERIFYDMETQLGTFLQAHIRRKKSFYAGQQILTRSDAEFHVYRGSYTTCDQSAPHFDFYSPRIKVLVDDMAIARPVYLRIKEKRVFWIPFYVFSLREDRQSGILTPSFGRRSIRFGTTQSEWELRNLGYYMAPNDYWDLTFSGDFRQRSGWLARTRLNYARRYHWNGQFETRLENGQDGNRTRWEWWTSMRHNQELGEGGSLRASGTFQSNKDFARDNSSSLQDRLNRTLRSNLSYSKRWRPSGTSLSLKASQTKNLDTERFDTVFPEVSLRTSRKALWTPSKDGERGAKKPWYSQIYYDGNTRLRNTERGSPADTTTRTSAALTLRLSSQQRPLSWLNFNSRLTETWKDADLRSSDFSSRNVRTDRLSTTAGLTQTFYGLFHPQIGRVTAFRHVLKPNLSINYQAAQTDTGGVAGVGGEGSSPWKQTRRITMRLDNTFWIKMQRGEEESKIRLAQLNFSTSYNMDNQVRPLADLVSSLNFNAGRTFDSRLTLTSEFYDDLDKLQLLSPRLERFEVRSSVNFSRRVLDQDTDDDRGDEASIYGRSREQGVGFSGNAYGRSQQQENFGFESGLQSDIRSRSRTQRFQLSHYYSRSRSSIRTIKRSWLRTSAATGWRQRWHFQYSLNYNLHAPEDPFFATARITSELLSIQREFHDWSATFNIEPSRFHRDRAFFFKAQFKDIPQIKFERGDRRL
jgi:hypothetical protein